MAKLVKALHYRLWGRGFDLEFFTIALGSTKLLTEKNTRTISWVKEGGGRGVNVPRALG
jgi:hypothetical protein